tara:strand:+ start:6860 stop:7900 length:1041 start_codon:yes stop_codon:yes gene_type:complete
MKRVFRNVTLSVLEFCALIYFSPAFSSVKENDDLIEILRTHTYIALPLEQQIEDEKATIETVTNVLNMFRETWQFKTDKITITPHNPSDRINAWFTPSENSLTFNIAFLGGRLVRTCRSIDIVSHETGHLFLKVLQPVWCRPCRPQTGAFDESFSDITAILFGLWHAPSRKRALKNLQSQKSCLGGDVGVCIRDMQTSKTLSELDSCEVHDLSQPFTAAVHDTLEDHFQILHQQGVTMNNICLGLARNFRDILVQGVLNTKDLKPSFGQIALNMIRVAGPYKNSLGQNFVRRQILVLFYKQIDQKKYYTTGPYEGICDPQTPMRSRNMTGYRYSKANYNDSFCMIL